MLDDCGDSTLVGSRCLNWTLWKEGTVWHRRAAVEKALVPLVHLAVVRSPSMLRFYWLLACVLLLAAEVAVSVSVSLC